MTGPTCAVCAKPLADGSVVCSADSRELAAALTAAAGHAEDAWTVIARQARYGTGGGVRAEPELSETVEDRRRNRVTAFGWAASIERPVAGGLRPEPLPVALGAADRYHAAENTITTWARDMDSDADSLAGAALWLAEHVEELRHHEAAGEAYDELTDACMLLERLVDRPGRGGDRLVGMCDCGKILYAPHGRDLVTCRACGQRWNVPESQAILLEHLDGKLVTTSEALDMAGWLDTDRTREQIRALIHAWAKRGQLAAHGYTWRDPTEAELRDDPEVGQVRVPLYRFGEVRARLAETPRRQRDGAAA